MLTLEREMTMIKENQIAQAARVLARSFQDDILMHFMFPDVEERKKHAKHFFEFIVRYGVLFGDIYAVSRDIEGVAAWLSSKTAEFPVSNMEKAGVSEFISHAGPEAGERMKLFTEFLRFTREEIVPYPHYAFWILGVLPEHQRKGYASTLIRLKVEEFDRDDITSYLETQTLENASLYERFDFRTVKTVPIPHSDRLLYCMVRKPRKLGSFR
ncbi:MAG: GNAT family N-acetyltransferase [Vulcanimicrobiota bacterium]